MNEENKALALETKQIALHLLEIRTTLELELQEMVAESSVDNLPLDDFEVIIKKVKTLDEVLEVLQNRCDRLCGVEKAVLADFRPCDDDVDDIDEEDDGTDECEPFKGFSIGYS